MRVCIPRSMSRLDRYAREEFDGHRGVHWEALMRSITSLRFGLTVAGLLVVGCRGINTVPEPVSPEAAVQDFELEIPPNLEVRNVDFSAVAYSDVTGSGGLVG